MTTHARVRIGKDALELKPQGETLVSTGPIPKGHAFLVVVRITAKPGDKTQNFRVPFHDGICAGCKLAEYACTCEDHGHEGSGHHH